MGGEGRERRGHCHAGREPRFWPRGRVWRSHRLIRPACYQSMCGEGHAALDGPPERGCSPLSSSSWRFRSSKPPWGRHVVVCVAAGPTPRQQTAVAATTWWRQLQQLSPMTNILRFLLCRLQSPSYIIEESQPIGCGRMCACFAHAIYPLHGVPSSVQERTRHYAYLLVFSHSTGACAPGN